MTGPTPEYRYENGLRAFFLRHPALLEGAPLVVAVSGGADSLALAHWLAHSSGRPAADFHFVHVDHGLRPEGGADGAFVAEMGFAWGVTVEIIQRDVPAVRRQEGGSLEAVARQLRYEALGAAAGRRQAGHVLTGHQADDQAETVLMRLLRGSGLDGLQGIQPISPWPVDGFPALSLVRPQLHVSREDILAYCQRQGLQPREDTSNLDQTLTRNRVRHELLPFLERYNPQVRQALARSADLLAADAALLAETHAAAWSETMTAEGEGWIRGRLPAWRLLPLSAQRAILRRGILQTAGRLANVSFEQVEQLRSLLLWGETGQIGDAGTGCRAYIFYDTFVLAAENAAAAFDVPQVIGDAAKPLPAEGSLLLENGWRLRVARTGDPAGRWQALLPRAERGALYLRGRQPGDRFAPAGMGGRTVKLKEFMIDRKIPAPLRASWPLVTDGREILWVAGLRLAQQVVEPEGAGGRVVWLAFEKEGMNVD